MAEEIRGRPTRGYGVGTEGPVGKVAPEAEADHGAYLALGAEQLPAAVGCLVVQISHRPASPPERSGQGHWAAKAEIHTLAQNNHSPGRNDTLEGGKHLAGPSDHLTHPSEA